MSDKLYELMDWPEIEAVVYSEENSPRNILGPRVTDDGILFQCFFPERIKVCLKTLSDGQVYTMVQEDEAGYFAALLPGKEIPDYVYLVDEEDGMQEYHDAYAFPSQITYEEEQKFMNGICYEIYEKLGAHPMTINGVDGVYFAVWAPNAMRVSVVGDFDHWDGRMYQMNLLPESGIYELFIPGVPVSAVYKYELKLKSGLTYLKADPYANAAELRPANASVVADLNQFKWKDKTWLKSRTKLQNEDAPIFVYEMHLGSWKKPEDGRDFYNYREIAPMLVEYIKEMGYTHVELMPVMEHPFDASWGYQVTGYYAPTSRYGSPEDFMFFVDTLHRAGIGVILDWVPAHFPRDNFGLASFDGTCLYEHLDPRQGYHPHWGTLIYNYGRPQVSNFLISNALFWADKFHVDGIRFDAVASMLYLDYGKNDGEWVANIYGGNENLEAVEFLKHLNSIFKKKYPGALLIAEESTAWPQITADVDVEDGLGFDYKWNMGWMNDFVGYMSYDPYFRGQHHDELTFSMVYAYSEKFMLSLSHDEVVHLKGSLLEKMPGTEEKKFANLRAAMGFFMTHPGKKLLFMGQDFAQTNEWSEESSLSWEQLEEDSHKKMKEYMKAVAQLYKEKPALYLMDYDPDGFEWINSVEWEKSMVTFMRKTKKQEDTLVVVCNFSDVAYDNYQIGVPYPGKYKEILNSDAVSFGGDGITNPRVKMARKEEADDRAYSIKIKVAPLSVSIFNFTKAVEKAATNKVARAKKKTAPAKKDGLKEEIQKKIIIAEAEEKPSKPVKAEKTISPAKKEKSNK
ncbi:MAG: 1,4-alpha-glucan branching protein GlgB [Clostridia bacterium]|nr:1,4-alpha-glucan branching protein GlgB [Clostridia bacterium]